MNDVEVVRSLYDAVARGDFAACVERLAPDVRWEVRGKLHLPDTPSTSHGIAAVQEWWGVWLTAWDGLSFPRAEPQERDDAVLVDVHQRARGRESGVEVDFDYFQAWRLRDGKIVVHSAADTAEEALAGLAGSGNLAVVEKLFASWEARDAAAAFKHYDEEIVWDARGQGNIQGVYHGHAGVRDYWAEWLDAWEVVEVLDPPDHVAHGNQVVSTWRQRMRGKTSGLEVESASGIVWTFQNGLVVRVAVFATRDEARAAAGLA